MTSTDRCGRCHRGLSAKLSVRRGLGPICFVKAEKEFEELDRQEPLSDHFQTIINRFIRDADLEGPEANYFHTEAQKAVEKNDKGLAKALGYEAVHYALSGKTALHRIPMLIQDIRNMFELASAHAEGDRQERYLKRILETRYRAQERAEFRQASLQAVQEAT